MPEYGPTGALSEYQYKGAFSAEPRELRKLERTLKKSGVIPQGFYYMNPEQDADKNWLVGER